MAKISRTPKINWPPSDWDEDDLYRDDETRLPQRLYPFELVNDRDERQLPLPAMTLVFDPYDGTRRKELGRYFDMWTGFRAMLDEYQAWFPKRPLEQVYFIGSELRVGQMVKIGYSTNPKARLSNLQTASPERLQIFVTCPGGETREREYHRRWHARRRSGEWFVLGDCILNEIARLKLEASS